MHQRRLKAESLDGPLMCEPEASDQRDNNRGVEDDEEDDAAPLAYLGELFVIDSLMIQ